MSSRPLVPVFSPPRPHEVEALALSAAYLTRAGNEAATRLMLVRTQVGPASSSSSPPCVTRCVIPPHCVSVWWRCSTIGAPFHLDSASDLCRTNGLTSPPRICQLRVDLLPFPAVALLESEKQAVHMAENSKSVDPR